jgi:hypothetical protein
MDRRGFLRLLGIGVAAAVAPTKAYSFLGGILRPRLATNEQDLEEIVANLGGMKQLPHRDYTMEIHEGRLWIICTSVDPNAMSTVTCSIAQS